jgi:hypothetical protein
MWHGVKPTQILGKSIGDCKTRRAGAYNHIIIFWEKVFCSRNELRIGKWMGEKASRRKRDSGSETQ